jgi:S-(hydroxymethyl)glutathione synthase
MRILETEITIDAAPQTVWSILDDLARYPEWNALVPDLSGTTIVGRTVTGTLKQPNTPDIPLSPTLIRIVAGRELRWLTLAPDPAAFSAEHIFILQPLPGGRTHLVHNEIFKGAVVEERWPGIDTNLRQAYNAMNHALKRRAESMTAAQVPLHPAISSGTIRSESKREPLTLRCRCAASPVEVEVREAPSHNHLCGCSKCWKPDGALLAQIAVVPRGTADVTKNGAQLRVVDAGQSIRRHACAACGTHMVGRVEDPRHHFFGLEFIHPELAVSGDAPAPEFAAFVSSVIESGATPSQMEAVRRRLSALGIAPYDGFSPELMDIIAWHRVKLAKDAVQPT